VHIILVFGWPLEEVKKIGGRQAYLQNVKGWVHGEKTIFILDEVQLSYEDSDLWGEFFEHIEAYDNLFSIAFASYGSPTSRINIRGAPFSVSDSQRVMLRPIDHGDGLDTVGLLFSRLEFDNLVCKQFPSSEYYFHPSLRCCL
jgi:hypothetical protein